MSCWCTPAATIRPARTYPLPQWERLTQLFLERQLTPFLDLAYQGFGSNLEEDTAPIRLVVDRVPEALVAVSYSKNLGLYRERVGAIITISENEQRADAVQSHVLQIARSIYSMPPDHGAAIAACIFADQALRQSWIEELAAMRNRIADMRSLLASHLRTVTHEATFDFLERQRGMFSLLGVSGETVEALRARHHIYMLGDSRMNLAGITPGNVRLCGGGDRRPALTREALAWGETARAARGAQPPR